MQRKDANIDQFNIFSILGCPRDVAINVVYFVTAAVEPTNTHIISFNQSESGNDHALFTISINVPLY